MMYLSIEFIENCIPVTQSQQSSWIRKIFQLDGMFYFVMFICDWGKDVCVVAVPVSERSANTLEHILYIDKNNDVMLYRSNVDKKKLCKYVAEWLFF